jgi:catechol 2,3-dioxygenase-like lactoylglutathione lyase family enzyme
VTSQIVHRWYARPVLFVSDVSRAIRFYVDMLGFEKSWHAGDGAGNDTLQIDDPDGNELFFPVPE